MVTPIGDTELTVAKPFVKEHEVVETRGWSFYEFNVTDQDFQVVVNVAEEEDSACETAGLFLTVIACLREQSYWHSSSNVANSQGIVMLKCTLCTHKIIQSCSHCCSSGQAMCSRCVDNSMHYLCTRFTCRMECIVHCSSRHLCCDPSSACAGSSMTVICLALV